MQNLNGGPPIMPDIPNQDLNSPPLPEAAQDAEHLLQCIPVRHSNGFLNESEVVAWKEQMETVSVSFPMISHCIYLNLRYSLQGRLSRVMVKQKDLNNTLSPLVARAESAIDEIEVSLKLDLDTQEEARRRAEEAAAEVTRKAAESLRAEKAKAARVREIQKEMAEIAGVGGIIHNPVSDSYCFFSSLCITATY